MTEQDECNINQSWFLDLSLLSYNKSHPFYSSNRVIYAELDIRISLYLINKLNTGGDGTHQFITHRTG